MNTHHARYPGKPRDRGTTLWLLALLLPAMLSAAHAASVTIGDKEWYQVRDLAGVAWNQMFNACYQGGTYVCTGSVAGQEITGWHWASGAEVLAMFSYVHPESTTGLDPWYSSWGDSLIQTGLIPTYHSLYYLDVWSGWTTDMPSWGQGQVTLWHNAGFTNQGSWDFTGYFTTNAVTSSPNLGAWLWRAPSQDSPAPCGAMAPCPPIEIPADNPIECGAAFPCSPVTVPLPGTFSLLAMALLGAVAPRLRSRIAVSTS